MGKPDAGNLHVRFDEGEGHGPAGPSLLDRFISRPGNETTRCQGKTLTYSPLIFDDSRSLGSDRFSQAAENCAEGLASRGVLARV